MARGCIQLSYLYVREPQAWLGDAYSCLTYMLETHRHGWGMYIVVLPICGRHTGMAGGCIQLPYLYGGDTRAWLGDVYNCLTYMARHTGMAGGCTQLCFLYGGETRACLRDVYSCLPQPHIHCIQGNPCLDAAMNPFVHRGIMTTTWAISKPKCQLMYMSQNLYLPLYHILSSKHMS